MRHLGCPGWRFASPGNGLSGESAANGCGETGSLGPGLPNWPQSRISHFTNCLDPESGSTENLCVSVSWW